MSDGTTTFTTEVLNLCAKRTMTLQAPAGTTTLHPGDAVELAFLPATIAPTGVSLQVGSGTNVDGGAFAVQKGIVSFTLPDLGVAGPTAGYVVLSGGDAVATDHCSVASCSARCTAEPAVTGWSLPVTFSP